MAKTDSSSRGAADTDAAPAGALAGTETIPLDGGNAADAGAGDDGAAAAGIGPAMLAVLEWCEANVAVTDQSSWAEMEALASRLLAAENPAEVLATDLSVRIERLAGIPMTVLGVRVGETEYGDGLPYYALMTVRYGEPPQQRVVEAHDFEVLAQLAKLDSMGIWPIDVVPTWRKASRKDGPRTIILASVTT